MRIHLGFINNWRNLWGVTLMEAGCSWDWDHPWVLEVTLILLGFGVQLCVMEVADDARD
jgi:hypothetical protein